MSKKRFDELKGQFQTQLLIGDRKFQDFHCLLGQAQTWAGTPPRRATKLPSGDW